MKEIRFIRSFFAVSEFDFFSLIPWLVVVCVQWLRLFCGVFLLLLFCVFHKLTFFHFIMIQALSSSGICSSDYLYVAWLGIRDSIGGFPPYFIALFEEFLFHICLFDVVCLLVCKKGGKTACWLLILISKVSVFLSLFSPYIIFIISLLTYIFVCLFGCLFYFHLFSPLATPSETIAKSVIANHCHVPLVHLPPVFLIVSFLVHIQLKLFIKNWFETFNSSLFRFNIISVEKTF